MIGLALEASADVAVQVADVGSRLADPVGRAGASVGACVGGEGQRHATWPPSTTPGPPSAGRPAGCRASAAAPSGRHRARRGPGRCVVEPAVVELPEAKPPEMAPALDDCELEASWSPDPAQLAIARHATKVVRTKSSLVDRMLAFLALGAASEVGASCGHGSAQVRAQLQQYFGRSFPLATSRLRRGAPRFDRCAPLG